MKITFHTFNIGDVDDGEIYVNIYLSKWKNTTCGKWVFDNANNLTWYINYDETTMSQRVSIRGDLTDSRKVTEYYLRCPNQEQF